MLTTAEAVPSDVGMGRARLDANSARALGASDGEIIEIIGKRATAARAFPLQEEEEGKGILRVDSIVRRNTEIGLGGDVSVRKADVLPATRVKIGLIISEGHMVSFGVGVEDFIKVGLSGRPLLEGDVVIIPGMALMGALHFAAMATVPQGIVVVSEGTTFEVSKVPLREAKPPEFPFPEDRFRATLHGLRDSLRDSLALVVTELANLRDEDAVGAKQIAGRIVGLLEEIETALSDRTR